MLLLIIHTRIAAAAARIIMLSITIYSHNYVPTANGSRPEAGALCGPFFNLAGIYISLSKQKRALRPSAEIVFILIWHINPQPIAQTYAPGTLVRPTTDSTVSWNFNQTFGSFCLCFCVSFYFGCCWAPAISSKRIKSKSKLFYINLFSFWKYCTPCRRRRRWAQKERKM